MSLTEGQLLDFLKRELAADPQLAADSPLFSTGELDSVAMLHLITYVEEAWRIQVGQDDVTLDNFDSVAAIVRFAGTKA